MPSTLILVRHAQSQSNEVGRLDTGLPGAGLTDKGYQQAGALLSRLECKPTVIYASIAKRARQTAEAMGAISGLPVHTAIGVQEAFAGLLDGRADQAAHQEFEQIIQRWHLGELERRALEGESGREVLARFIPAINQIYREHMSASAHSTVVLVSHGTALRLVAKTLAGMDGRFTSENRLANGEFVKLVRGPDRWQCTQWGSRILSLERRRT